MKKNIYIKDTDVKLFERAEELGGESISSVIADALKKYVDVKEAEASGLQEYTLTVGTVTEQDEDTRKVKFTGRKLASGTTYHGSTNDRNDRGNTWELYQTKAGKIIVYLDDWSRWQGEASRSYYAVRDELPGYEDEVFESFGWSIPGNILQEAAEALGQELVEYVE